MLKVVIILLSNKTRNTPPKTPHRACLPCINNANTGVGFVVSRWFSACLPPSSNTERHGTLQKRKRRKERVVDAQPRRVQTCHYSTSHVPKAHLSCLISVLYHQECTYEVVEKRHRPSTSFPPQYTSHNDILAPSPAK